MRLIMLIAALLILACGEDISDKNLEKNTEQKKYVSLLHRLADSTQTYQIPSIDNKQFAQDTTPFSEAFVREGKHPSFLNSPITDGLTAKDICIYGPGDLNKNGKEGKTSWDSFSYAVMMGHNVWMHINAVQEANRQYDAGKIPNMLVQETFDTVMFRDIVEAIFATDDREVADAIIEEYSRYWMSIIGTRGATGKKTVNATTQFNNLFEDA